MVQENPQFQSIIISHVMQHLQFLATQIAEQQMDPEMQQRIAEIQMQMQQVSPEEAQQIQQQIQMIMDELSSPILAELTQAFLSSIGQANQGDPLVAIRQQELDLKDKELDMEQMQFDSNQEQKNMNSMLNHEWQKQRLDIQKIIADDKLQLGFDRLKQQADLKLLELEQKFGSIQ